MKSLEQLIMGIGTAAGSVLLVLAAIMLSLVEGNPAAVAAVTQSPSRTSLPSSTSGQLISVTQTGSSATITFTVQPSATITLTSTASSMCPPPSGWISYMVETGDDLNTLAQRAGATVDELMRGNCLLSDGLMPGSILFLPVVTPTQTLTVTVLPTRFEALAQTLTPSPPPIPCGPPRGWVKYTVQSKDNLYRISQAFGVSVSELMVANCLSSTLIQTGLRLYVPNVATRTPSVQATQTPTPHKTNTPTLEPTLTASSTPTPTNLPSSTFTAIPSLTPVPPTATADQPTETPMPSQTKIITPIITSTSPATTTEAFPSTPAVIDTPINVQTQAPSATEATLPTVESSPTVKP